MRKLATQLFVLSAVLLSSSAAYAATSAPYDLKCSVKTWNGSAEGHKTCTVTNGVQMCGPCSALGAVRDPTAGGKGPVATAHPAKAGRSDAKVPGSANPR